ncbi:DUF302 domain-containing protein [Aciditerrimonas ferrireducens]|uniref:DUF302 domain-containing protein n=1 Tax=Aciditerrimonas ferrireducens TaxID=667306 RepID=A0ABV6BZH4_9ACTN
MFATIDHAAGARSVGVDMPESTVLVVGNPAAGAPPMLDAPNLALDLPTRVLVRQASPGAVGSSVVLSDPRALARRHGLRDEQVEALGQIVSVIDRALEQVSTR